MGALSKSKIHPTINSEIDDNHNLSIRPVNHHKSKEFFKINGWTQPFHPLQLLAFFFFFFFTGICFFIMLPMLPTSSLRYIVYPLTGLLFVSHLIFHLINITINPADPAVIDKYDNQQQNESQLTNRKGPKTFDRSKHNHVIENQFCYICEVNVGPKSKHCSVCNKCVSNFDHHCKWLNNCVGGANYRLFLVCVTIAMIGSISIFGLTIVFTIAYFNQSSWFYDESIWEDDFITNGLLRAYIINPSTCYRSIWITIIMMTSILSLVTGILLLHLLCFHIFLNCIGLSTYEFIVSRRQSKDLESEKRSSLTSSSSSASKRVKLPSRLIQIAPCFRWCCQARCDENDEKTETNGQSQLVNHNQRNTDCQTDLVDERKINMTNSSISATLSSLNHFKSNPLIPINQFNGKSLIDRLGSTPNNLIINSTDHDKDNNHQQLNNEQIDGKLKDGSIDRIEYKNGLLIDSMNNYHRSSLLRNSWLNSHRSFEESHGQVYLGSPERRFWESFKSHNQHVKNNQNLPYNQLTVNNNARNQIVSIANEQLTHNLSPTPSPSSSSSSSSSTTVDLIEDYPSYQTPSRSINSEINDNHDQESIKLSTQSVEPIFTPINLRRNLINGRTSRLSFTPKVIESTTTTNPVIYPESSTIESINHLEEDKIVNPVNTIKPSNPIVTPNRGKVFLRNRQLTQPILSINQIDRSVFYPSLSIDNLKENVNNQFNENDEKIKRQTISGEKQLTATDDVDILTINCIVNFNENHQNNNNIINDNQISEQDNQSINVIKSNHQVKRFQSNVEISSQL